MEDEMQEGEGLSDGAADGATSLSQPPPLATGRIRPQPPPSQCSQPPSQYSQPSQPSQLSHAAAPRGGEAARWDLQFATGHDGKAKKRNQAPARGRSGSQPVAGGGGKRSKSTGAGGGGSQGVAAAGKCPDCGVPQKSHSRCIKCLMVTKVRAAAPKAKPPLLLEPAGGGPSDHGHGGEPEVDEGNSAPLDGASVFNVGGWAGGWAAGGWEAPQPEPPQAAESDRGGERLRLDASAAACHVDQDDADLFGGSPGFDGRLAGGGGGFVVQPSCERRMGASDGHENAPPQRPPASACRDSSFLHKLPESKDRHWNRGEPSPTCRTPLDGSPRLRTGGGVPPMAAGAGGAGAGLPLPDGMRGVVPRPRNFHPICGGRDAAPPPDADAPRPARAEPDRPSPLDAPPPTYGAADAHAYAGRSPALGYRHGDAGRSPALSGSQWCVNETPAGADSQGSESQSEIGPSQPDGMPSARVIIPESQY